MCRWLAYAGPPIYLDSLLLEPQNSLIRQSLRARHASEPTNGDGFGLGWYGARPMPGLFRDTLPAWNDENLRSVAQQVESRLFFAHVRASTGTHTSRSNCHPFRYEDWLFMHNGRIGGWLELRQRLEQSIDERFYRHRVGTTDSEALFLLALSLGLKKDPVGAMQAAVGQTLAAMTATGAGEPFRMTAALSNGETIWAFRYSSDGQSPSLYWGDEEALPRAAEKAVAILSEPLDDDLGSWRGLGEGQTLICRPGQVDLLSFLPSR